MKDFFTSLPGILVISGVVLLVISIILFLIGLKKNKKEKNTKKLNDEIKANNQEEVKEEVISTIDIDKIADNMINEIKNGTEETQEKETINEETTVKNEEVAANQNEVIEPIIEDSSNDFDFTLPEEEPIIIGEEKPEPIIEIPTEVPTEDHQAYGGNEPVVDFKLPEENHTTIYGGNDPLEKTQNIKPITEPQSQPYGIESDVTVIEEPVNNVVNEMPEIEPVVINNEVSPEIEEPIISNPTEDNNEVEEL